MLGRRILQLRVGGRAGWSSLARRYRCRSPSWKPRSLAQMRPTAGSWSTHWYSTARAGRSARRNVVLTKCAWAALWLVGRLVESPARGGCSAAGWPGHIVSTDAHVTLQCARSHYAGCSCGNTLLWFSGSGVCNCRR